MRAIAGNAISTMQVTPNGSVVAIHVLLMTLTTAVHAATPPGAMHAQLAALHSLQYLASQAAHRKQVWGHAKQAMRRPRALLSNLPRPNTDQED